MGIAADALRPAGRRRTMTAVLARAIAVAVLIPFLPLVALTWWAYRTDVARAEREIQSTNRQIADLAANYLDGLARQVQLHARHARVVRSDALPDPVPGVLWERVDDRGRVVASAVESGRVGGSSGYAELLTGSTGEPVPRFVPLPRPLGELGATSALFAPLPDTAGWLVAVLDPGQLHRETVALSSAALTRHVYAVGEDGRPIFYADPGPGAGAGALRGNPPVRLFLSGGAGELRFTSTVSGRARLGVVRRAPVTGWGVIVSADPAERLLDLRSRYAAIAASTVFALLAAVAVLLWTSRTLGRPVLAMGEALRDRSRAPHDPLPVPSRARQVAEYDDLVRALDDLSARAATAERDLVQAEKTLLLGQLASGLAHEIGTPLNVITGNAQYLLRKVPGDDAAAPTLRLIVKQAERIGAMITRVLDFSRPAEVRLAPVSLAAVVDQTLEMVRGVTGTVATRVAIDPHTPPVEGDARLLEHVLVNLILNGCQAMPAGGTLEVTAASDPGDPDWVVVRVADSGCGIPAEQLAHVFEPFFTTKPQGQGTGLGLAIVERIVRQHGGTVSVASEAGVGSTFTLKLRRSRDEKGRP